MSNVPGGYRPLPKPADQRPMVPYDRLRNGREVIYVGTRRIRSQGKEYTIHDFDDVQTAASFGLWGCAQLDMQLMGMRGPVSMFLQYDGKEQKRNGRTAHSFTIGVSGDMPIAAMETTSDEPDDLPF